MTRPAVTITSTADLTPAPGLAGVRKAVSAGVTAAVAAGAAALTTAAPDGFTTTEWVAVVGATIVAGMAAFFAAYVPKNDVVAVTVVQ
jgi:hypothetical protein